MAKTPSTKEKMTEAVVYNTKGQDVGKYKLPEDIFGLPWNADLVHQVVQSMLSSIRKPYAHTKTRGEVSGGGKKPWQQKGTGRARHGSTRSPIWVHGGIAHGPRNDKNFDRKVNAKMKAKALYTILSRKMKEGEVLFMDSLSLSQPKAKEAKEILGSLGKVEAFKKLSTKKKNAILVAMDKKNDAVEKGFRNFGHVKVDEARNLNPVELSTYKYVMFVNPDESVKAIAGKLNK
ncbi:MAG TPA: 50S ribosomal protein L4 [Candidatus Nanoarchaeia archaeon]|nr:50S ribosomal protein L4 [Candidatus Nanoarchaeia archaeon]